MPVCILHLKAMSACRRLPACRFCTCAAWRWHADLLPTFVILQPMHCMHWLIQLVTTCCRLKSKHRLVPVAARLARDKPQLIPVVASLLSDRPLSAILPAKLPRAKPLPMLVPAAGLSMSSSSSSNSSRSHMSRKHQCPSARGPGSPLDPSALAPVSSSRPPPLRLPRATSPVKGHLVGPVSSGLATMLLADGHPKAPGLKAIPEVPNLKQPLLSIPHPKTMLQQGSVAAGQQGCSQGLNLRVLL